MRRFSVHAAIYYEDILRAIGPYWPTEFPQLKELDLAVVDNLADIVEDFIGIAPNVVKLELFCHYHPRSFEVIPAWDLTHLELSLLENGQCLEEIIGVIAVYAPTLQSLEVYVLDVGEIDEEYDTIMFPHLRTLTAPASSAAPRSSLLKPPCPVVRAVTLDTVVCLQYLLDPSPRSSCRLAWACVVMTGERFVACVSIVLLRCPRICGD